MLTGIEGVSYEAIVVLVIRHQLVDAGPEWRVGRHHRQERTRHVLKLRHFVVDVRQPQTYWLFLVIYRPQVLTLETAVGAQNPPQVDEKQSRAAIWRTPLNSGQPMLLNSVRMGSGIWRLEIGQLGGPVTPKRYHHEQKGTSLARSQPD